MRIAVVFTAALLLSLSPPARAQVETAAEICNAAGVCAPMDPATAIIVVALAQLAKELAKDDPFGKNNELVKILRNMISDVSSGPGPNNDLAKALGNIESDLKCGPGPNNDVIKFLASLGIKIQTRTC